MESSIITRALSQYSTVVKYEGSTLRKDPKGNFWGVSRNGPPVFLGDVKMVAISGPYLLDDKGRLWNMGDWTLVKQFEPVKAERTGLFVIGDSIILNLDDEHYILPEPGKPLGEPFSGRVDQVGLSGYYVSYRSGHYWLRRIVGGDSTLIQHGDSGSVPYFIGEHISEAIVVISGKATVLSQKI